MTLLFILKSLIFSQLLLLLVSAREEKCPSYFDCGNLGQIKFPFTVVAQYPQCGILAIQGCEDKNPYASKSIQLGNTTFNITYVDHDIFTITDDVRRKNLKHRNCQAINNVTLPPTSPLASFGYNIYYNNLPNTFEPPGFKEPSSLAQCTMFQVGVRDSVTGDPFAFLSPEIYVSRTPGPTVMRTTRWNPFIKKLWYLVIVAKAFSSR